MQKLKTTLFLCLFLSVWACQPKEKAVEKKQPNIVYILADDLGYGDISSFNPDSKIQTPNIDQLSKEGMRFTDAHSGSSVCTPTRYGILTGRYAWRSTLKKGVTWTFSKHLINPERLTVGKVLQSKGYNTACIGKWHLGFDWEMISEKEADYAKPIQNSPNVNGFDYFFGIKASLDIPPYFYIENNQITASSIDTIEAVSGKQFWRKGAIGNDFKHIEVLPTLTEKAVSYINEQAKTENPFFLYFPLPAPHTPILPTEKFQEKTNTNEYGDFVMMVDDVVGQVMQALANNNLTDNTLIIFTTDNGCSPMADFDELAAVGHQPSYQFRGHKADIFEGGHRVPFVARWPGVVAASSQSDQTICHTDLMRTCAAIVGSEIPDAAAEDSYSILPLLKGDQPKNDLREATVHHSVNGSYAIRKGDWKLILCPGSGGWSYPTPKEAKKQELVPYQLYNLKEDIGETKNVAADNAEKLKELSDLLRKYINDGRSTKGTAQKNEGEMADLGIAPESWPQ